MKEIATLVGQTVVLDLRAPYTVIGRLTGIGDESLTIEDADVHCTHDSPSTREIYVLETAKYGVRMNRKKALIRLEDVVCVSLLEDVLHY